MQELSLNILDVANNSIRANATLVQISIAEDSIKNLLAIKISDNGCGMDEEQLQLVQDPFFTTRTTRNVGLGIPLFKMSAIMSGGNFEISSKLNEGTCVAATYKLNHIDRVPMGDITSTFVTLVGGSPDVDFVMSYCVDGNCLKVDTRQFKEILGDIPLNSPEILAFISDYIKEILAPINPKS
ncbi:MAG: ATP-binding protein [Oscillospiraceae bacterium]